MFRYCYTEEIEPVWLAGYGPGPRTEVSLGTLLAPRLDQVYKHIYVLHFPTEGQRGEHGEISQLMYQDIKASYLIKNTTCDGRKFSNIIFSTMLV